MTGVLLLSGACAWGYRPFVSTDAVVADPQELEIELGCFGLKHVERKNTVLTPQVVLNYGLARNWEIVGEFSVEKPPDASARLIDPGLFLKAILKEGTLQNKDGAGFAIEVGPLFPSTARKEKQFGFEGIGIVSGEFFPFTYHLNLGGGVERTETNPFVLWGVIVEWSVLSHFRLVGEVNGESAKGEWADNSGLLGFIWQPPSSDILIDVGVRKGFNRQTADWQLVTGLTWSFSFPFVASASRLRGTP